MFSGKKQKSKIQSYHNMRRSSVTHSNQLCVNEINFINTTVIRVNDNLLE